MESLSRKVDQLFLQLNSLSGVTLPQIALTPSYAFRSTSTKDAVISTAASWVSLRELELSIPEGTDQVIVSVAGTLQLTGTDASNDAPWVNVRVGLDSSYTRSIPDPGGQGVRAANNSAGVFLATISASLLLPVAGQSNVSVRLEGWSSSGSNFATPSSSNLASLFVQSTFFPAPLVESGG